MTNEPRTPSPADGGWQGKVAGSIPPLGPPTLCGPLTDKDFRPADHCGIVEVDPADFDRARELAKRLRERDDDDTIEAADLIEQLLAERAVAVQAGEKIGRAKGLAYARKLSQRIAKLGVRTWR